MTSAGWASPSGGSPAVVFYNRQEIGFTAFSETAILWHNENHERIPPRLLGETRTGFAHWLVFVHFLRDMGGPGLA